MINPPCGRHYETVSECAERCKVSVRTLQRAIADGRIRAYGLTPAMVRLDVHEVDEAFATR